MFSGNLLQLRHVKSKHLSLQHPTSLKYFDNNTLSAPRSLVLDGTISYGGSSGYGVTLINKAYGEYWERNHFQTAVPITSQKRLEDVYPLAHRNKLLSLCNPLCQSMSKTLASMPMASCDFEKVIDPVARLGDTGDDAAITNQRNNHLFSFSTVYNLFDEQPYDYFYNAISLHTLHKDALFLGMTDSIACASHPVKKQALYHSLVEFLERQSLVGSWISKTHRYSINPSVLGEITPYSHLYNALIDNGDLYLFEIGNQLPGYSVIIFYFAHSAEDIVQYAVGSKSGLSLDEAINSAFDELYQTYTMLYQTKSSAHQFENKAGSSYHAMFPRFNTQKTKELIPYFDGLAEHKINTRSELKALPVFSFKEVLVKLKEFSPDVFFYHYYEPAIKLHFTKILSYDFFAHMSLGKQLRLDGLYAKKLNITADNAYLEPLPFP